MATENFNYRDLDNVTLVNLIRQNDPMSFGERIPPATKATLEKTWAGITQHQPAMNSFVSTLINRVGMTVFTQKKAFTNPLGEFKSDRLAYGNAVQEIATGLLQAHTYDPRSDGETVFQREQPITKAIYHEVNRENFYRITVNRARLAAAFLSEGGLIEYVDQLMSAPVTSDNLDEFLLMVDLFRKYHESGGFFYIPGGMNTITDDAVRSKDLLRKIRATSENMAFPNKHYNAGNMPTWANPADLFVFTTPTQKSFIDVDALAGAFNIDRMNVHNRIVTIPDHMWPLADVNAVLTTRDFFKVFDNTLQTGSIENPMTLNINTYLHHWQIISCSIFAPAVAFTNSLETIQVQADSATVAVGDIVAVNIYPRLPEQELSGVQRGSEIALDVDVTITDDGVFDTGVIWEIRGNNSPHTIVTPLGNVIVGADETAETLTVRAYLANDPLVNDEATLTLTGPVTPVMADRRPEGDPEDDPEDDPEVPEEA